MQMLNICNLVWSIWLEILNPMLYLNKTKNKTLIFDANSAYF